MLKATAHAWTGSYDAELQRGLRYWATTRATILSYGMDYECYDGELRRELR